MRKKKSPVERTNLTVRLAKKADMSKSEIFSAEQWEELKKLRPNIPGSILVQHALLHYAKTLPSLLIEEHEKELERLHQVKYKLTKLE
ncbi:hypothetical protein HOV30_gp111 [Erwinia phage Derbicus]|uniref:Uncharacterized protein n=2 Tax=Derbicusvirus derbicus TaxID=2734104 RepID=A0A482IJ26_9CAUD|nr:hypothetical protein BIZ82_gp111 [Erwinia phage vB_EamM_EarlPhillipIV]YP_009821155.1 hypothetical protein HOV30_gp111 [Erwinia phage Derbicus]ANZ48960.1 hypothetical protein EARLPHILLIPIV_111 [Erwinia phage vB_EamM_EarlPhillipIV]QBP07537.1 hypothetical protein DERBICUS_111 [Erwinia phage Derbicus]